MRALDEMQESLFTAHKLEHSVRSDYPLRIIGELVNDAIKRLRVVTWPPPFAKYETSGL